MTATKRVYLFGNGHAEGKADMKNLLGGKGANLAEMNLIGVPVPPGFTITTDACIEYNEVGPEKMRELLMEEVKTAVKHVEDIMVQMKTRCWFPCVAVPELRCRA
jgi:pyruvate,orthophosphate dikinase